MARILFVFQDKLHICPILNRCGSRFHNEGKDRAQELDCQERLKMLAELFETGLVVRKCGQFLVV